MGIELTARVRAIPVARTAEDVAWLAGRLEKFFAGATNAIYAPVGGDENPVTVLQDVEARTVWMPEDAGLIMRTSGSTTGSGRLVGLSATQMRASAAATEARLGGPCSWVLALAPHHIAGLQVVARALLSEREVVTCEGRVDAESIVAAIDRAHAAHPDGRVAVSLVPTQLARLLADEQATAALARCTAVLLGGAAASQELLSQADAATITVLTTYGMSETCGGCVYDGMPLEGVQVDLAADGRIGIRGPMVMSGYLDEGPVGERLITNDLGHWQDGRLIIDGRADDVINSGALKIPADVVAREIMATGMVREAVVVGVDDRTWGQLVCAVVVPGRGWKGPQELRNLVGRRIGRVRSPRAVVEADDLPMLASGKVDRKAATLLAQQRTAAGMAWLATSNENDSAPADTR